MTVYGWCRETQTLKQRRIQPDCELCGRPESALYLIKYHGKDLGIPTNTRACKPCKQQAERRLPGPYRKLFTESCPARYWPEAHELPEDDRRELMAKLDADDLERRAARALRTDGWATYHGKPYAELTLDQRRWEEQYHEDYLDALEFDRMASE